MRHVRVDFSRADIDQEPGARALLSRLKRASSRACGRSPDPFAAQSDYHACRRQALAQAVSDVRSSSLSALYTSDRPALMARR